MGFVPFVLLLYQKIRVCQVISEKKKYRRGRTGRAQGNEKPKRIL
jgi:hypothetical protein